MDVALNVNSPPEAEEDVTVVFAEGPNENRELPPVVDTAVNVLAELAAAPVEEN